MLDRSNVAFIYDGSYEGFFSLIFECFEQRIFPLMISDREETLLLAQCRRIVTDPVKSQRVAAGIKKKMTLRAIELINSVWLTELPDKELLLLGFVEKGMRLGAEYICCLADRHVSCLMKAAGQLRSESHKFIEFIRFSDCSGVLAASISPVNRVLPVIEPHFTDRYREEKFLIYDRTHKCALIYDGEGPAVVSLEEFCPPPADENEKNYRDLWRMFYNTIAIESRKNERGRMNHMPRRFWGEMTEFTQFEQNILPEAPNTHVLDMHKG